MRGWVRWLPPAAGLAILVGLAIGCGWLWRHRFELLGPRDVTVAESEVVSDIRPLDRLVVFRAYAFSVTTTHEIGWLSRSDQTMLTPAYVNYFVDMAKVTPDMVRVRGGQVLVALPPLMIERPNIDVANVRTFNAGLWSSLTATADRMRVANNRQAIGQLYAQARMPFLLDAARRAEVAAVAANVRNALAADGHAGLTVRVVS